MQANIHFSQTRMQTTLVVVLMFALKTSSTSAHEGPPFPVIVDQPVEEYLISVWADPDLGTGTFYVMIDPAHKLAELAEPDVEVWVQPTSGRIPKASYTAEREAIRNRMQFAAFPEFDALETWSIGVRITPPDGKTAELTTKVEVTPPGLGPWDLAIYLFPFALIGGLWGIALIRRWRSESDVKSNATGTSLVTRCK